MRLLSGEQARDQRHHLERHNADLVRPLRRRLIPHAHVPFTRVHQITVEAEEREAADIILQPGEMSLPHVLMPHGWGASRSDDRRMAYPIRSVPTRSRRTAGPPDSSSLVRGADAYGHFELEPR